MNLSDLTNLLSSYGADKILLAVLSLAISLTLKKLVFKKSFKRLSAMCPFLVGTAFSLIAGAFTEKDFAEIVKEGVNIGSAATVIYTFIMSFILGDGYENIPVDSLVLEGMLAGYIPNEELADVAEVIAEALREQSASDPENAVFCVKKAILECAPNVPDEVAELMAKAAVNVFIASK